MDKRFDNVSGHAIFCNGSHGDVCLWNQILVQCYGFLSRDRIIWKSRGVTRSVAGRVSGCQVFVFLLG